MGNLCSKRAVTPVSDDIIFPAAVISNSRQEISPLLGASHAHHVPQPSGGGRLLGNTAARACAMSVCSKLESIFSPVISSLDQQLAAVSPTASTAALNWPALQLVQLQAFICNSLTTVDTPDTIRHLLAVLYTLALAAPTAVAGTIATHSPAIMRLIAVLSVIHSNQGSDSCAQTWSHWQQLASAVGLTPCHLPVVLTPASKAVLFQLEAAAQSASVHTVRLQVHRKSVFADVCAALLPGAACHLPCGPCVVCPAFFAASPGAFPTKLSSSPTSMWQVPSAGSSQIVGHSIPGTALSSSMDVQCCTGSEFAQHDEADSAIVSGNVIEHETTPALQEEGEGRGPRKEFFASVGADITSAGGLYNMEGAELHPRAYPLQQYKQRQCLAVMVGQAHAGHDPTLPKQTALIVPCGFAEALFVYNSSAACYWYNTRLQPTEQTQQQFQTAGWLAGQALHNRAALGVRLAPLLWHKVLEGDWFQASVQSLQDFDPEMSHTLLRVLQSPGPDLVALLQLEGLPQDTTADAYVQQAVQQVCVEQVQWQAANFAQGFCAAVSLDLLQRYLVTPQDLAEMVSGSMTSWHHVKSVQDVFHLVLDTQLQQQFADLSRCLWEVVNGWDVELKQQFLFFVTGSGRLPQPYTELLRIELPFVAFDQRDHAHMLSRLPQAHTCNNTLELPNYQESLCAMHSCTMLTAELKAKLRNIVHDRLKLAVTCCNSYGLDQCHA